MNNLPSKLLITLIVIGAFMGDVLGTTKSIIASHTRALSREAVLETVTNGTISGKVTRSDGVTAIAGATVKALQGTTTISTTTTNGTGDYTLADLAAGSYRIEATATGFGTKSQSPVTVSEGGNTVLNFKLDAIVGGPISYLYDALGRLVATVGPTETTVYTYDAVGNLLSISSQPSNQLSIISVVPNRGSVGQLVTINGTGFSGIAAENDVKFHGVPATVQSATSNRIITTVPSVGVTGQVQIAVTTSQGTVTAPFPVLPASSAPSIQVAPSYVSILPGDTLQFVASITGLSGNQSLTWSVNGVDGGNSNLGTISSSGFYTSPNQPGSIFAIRATSVANPAIFGQAQVAVLNPSLAEALISRSISVVRRPALDVSPTTAVAVRRTVPESVAPITQVSVRRLPQAESGAPIASSVSVRRLPPTESGAPILTGISVRRTDATTSASTESASVSLTKGPLVQSLTPTSASKGTSFTITINGANLGGTTGISVLTTDGAVDSNVSASNITVDPNGTSLTATITVSGSAALGQRVVVITTVAGNSLTVNVGTNVLEIVQ